MTFQKVLITASRIFFRLVAILSILFVSAGQLQAVSYAVQDLGAMWPYAFNDSGQVVAAVNNRAVLYSNGALTDLGTLGGATSTPTAINNMGEIVGYSKLPDGTTHGFLYSNGVMTDLGTFGGSYSTALDINDKGQIVGTYGGINWGLGYLLNNGVMTDLGTLGGQYTNASGINASGQLVGSSELADGSTHAFVYSDGQMTDIGSLGADSYGSKINTSGQIVGVSNIVPNTRKRAYIYSNGLMTDLGANTSWAEDINEAGEVVGELAVGGLSHGFVYRDGTVTDLNSLIDPNLHVDVMFAVAIDSNGRILASGNKLGDVNGHAYILTPVPEPSTLILFAVGCVACLPTLVRSWFGRLLR